MERNIAQLAGTIIGVVFPLVVGIVFSIVLTKRREDFKVTAWPTVIGVILTFAGCTAVLNRSKGSNEIEINRSVVGKAQQFDGLLTPPGQAILNEEAKADALNYFKQREERIDAARVHVKTSQVYPFIVTRTEVSVPGKLFMYIFIGVRATDMVSVECISQSGRQFDVDFLDPNDKCGRTVKDSIELDHGIRRLEPGKRQPGLQ